MTEIAGGRPCRNLAPAALAAGLLTAGILGASPARAADADSVGLRTYPWLSVELSVEVQGDFTVSSDDPAAEINDVYPIIEPFLALHFNERWRAEAGFVLEPVRDPVDDRFFEDAGLYLETLQLVYEANGLALSAGKQTPAFGVGWDLMPGVYGDTFAEAYEYTERWGVTAAYTADMGHAGLHTLSASTFFLDTTALSDSVITRRGRTSIFDGGPSNTEDFSSLAVSLTGADVFGAQGLGYHLAYARQDSDLFGESAEDGVVAALFHETTLTNGLTVAPIMECAFYDDFESMPGADAQICSGALSLAKGPWSFAAGGGGADIDGADLSFVHLGAGYAFDAFTAELGYRRLDEDGTVSHTLGVLFSRTFAWDGPLR